jgi:2-oxoglutarate ferredoxin oxidoreductase subunit delta
MMEKAEKGKKEPNIDVFRAWCKGCGICVAFCPSGALAKDETGQPFVQDASKCIRCGWCEMRCPDFAITVQNKRDDNGQASEGEA